MDHRRDNRPGGAPAIAYRGAERREQVADLVVVILVVVPSGGQVVDVATLGFGRDQLGELLLVGVGAGVRGDVTGHRVHQRGRHRALLRPDLGVLVE
ncbi:hypothetical protein [Dietzia sp. 179-F 9C3 NHS]|uniref:hypothetical protein n=1 Tax=Dietzia sp. 179-F 9C3 NHS TaxID=3374295 RepID=UPI003879C810